MNLLQVNDHTFIIAKNVISVQKKQTLDNKHKIVIHYIGGYIEIGCASKEEADAKYQEFYDYFDKTVGI